LNENRPRYAEGYRFIDLDSDGKEELLISDDVNVIAVYTCNFQNNKPISIFTQGTGMYYYTVLGNGIICFNPSPNLHGQAYGHIYYHISEGELVPIVGYISNSYPSLGYYKTDKKELLTAPLSLDFSEWDEISSEDFNRYYNNNYVNNNLKLEPFNPYMESFADYDAEQEFQRTNQEKPIAVSGQYGYDELIQRYKDLLASPNLLSTIDLAIGTSHLNMDNMSYLWKEEPYTKPCFILRDLNGDGIYEFATGNQENDGSFTLYDLYTIKNNKIIHIASSYVRIRYSINSKNEIIEYNFGGAANSTATSFTLSNGKLKTTGKLIMDNSKCYYYNNFGTAIENKQEIIQDEYVEKSNTLFSRNPYQEVILFKDWYKGMSLESLENGDVNGDGHINAVDASTVLAYYAMISTNKDGGFSNAQKAAADVNHDGLINAVDASCILSYYAYVSTTKEEILSLEEYLKK
jgi:hypothetical protein